jgi:hypothetical protein
MQFLKLKAKYTEFINTYNQVKCFLLSSSEIVALYQLTHVLRPFKKLTLKLLESMLLLAISLKIY